MDKAKVFLIKIDSMGGPKKHDTAFTDEETCKFFCSKNEQEFINYVPEEAEGEIISGGRVIVDNKVYFLDETDAQETMAKDIVKNLTKEQDEALRLYYLLEEKKKKK